MKKTLLIVYLCIMLVCLAGASAYSDSTGFLHYYTFDSDSKDYYGRSNGTDYNVTYIAANISNGAYTNGTSSYIKFTGGMPLINMNTTLTIGFFNKMLDCTLSTGAGNTSVLMSFSNVSPYEMSTSYGFWIVQEADRMYLRYRNGSSTRTIYTTTGQCAAINNTWTYHTFTFSYDIPTCAYTTKYYQNGVLLNTSVSSAICGFSQLISDVRFGKDTGTSWMHTGIFDEVLIANRTFSDREVYFLYQDNLRGIRAIDNQPVVHDLYFNKTTGYDGYACNETRYACQNISRLNNFSLVAGDNVSFNRGDEWWFYYDAWPQFDYSGNSSAYITYKAHGSGMMPVWSGGVNLTSNLTWTNSSTTCANCWNSSGNISADVGNMLMNNNTIMGYKEYNIGNLTAQGDFYYDSTNDRIIMYSALNPGNNYTQIIASTQEAYEVDLVDLGGSDYINITGLNLKYGAQGGISGNDLHDVWIKNNKVEFMGGAIQSGTTRYGNCIGFGLGSRNVYVGYNNVSECWDACYSPQAWASGGTKSIINQQWEYNIGEKCAYPYEYFSSDADSDTANINITQNTFAQLGYGLFYGHRGHNNGQIRLDRTPVNTTGFRFINNVIYNSSYRLMAFDDGGGDWLGEAILNNNLYYLSSGSYNFTYNGTNYGSFSSYQAGSGQDTNSQYTNPIFISGTFVPYADSPACTMSSTGGYVGAVPCSTTEYYNAVVKIINSSMNITGDKINVYFNTTFPSNCTLYINDTIQVYNETTLVNTKTNLTSPSIIDGNKNIYVNCTNGYTNNKSNVINATITIEPISGMTQTESTDDSISIEWTNPTPNFNHTEIWIQNGSWILLDNTTDDNYTITGLEPATSYSIIGVSVGDGGTRGSNTTLGSSTEAETNDTTTFFVSHTFTELNMTDGCNGNISFAANSTHWAAICLNDMISDVYCYNYTTGIVGVDETTYFNYTLTYGNSYRFHYIWNMIYYESMNDTNINGQYDTGASITATYRTECQNTYVDECSSTIDNHQLSTTSDCYSDSMAYPYTCDTLYIAGHYCDNDYAINLDDKENYVKALPDDYRVYVGQSTKVGASNASGTCELINRRKSSSTCYSIVTPYYLMDECTDGVEEYERYPLCDYAGSYDSYTDSFVYYGSAGQENISANAGEEIGSYAILNIEQDGNPPSEITIYSPTEGENTTRYINITYSVVGSDFEYFNISLLNANLSFNSSIQANNSDNLSYYWDTYNKNLSIQTYYVKVAAILANGSEAINNYVSFNVTRNMALNISARTMANGTIANFSGSIRHNYYEINESFNTTSGSVIINWIKGNSSIIVTSDDYATNNLTDNYTNTSSNAYIYLYDTNTLNITFLDQNNNSLVSGINITLEIISDSYANNYTTDNGTIYLSGLSADTYILRYSAPNYIERFYLVELEESTYHNLDLYMIRSEVSSNITVYVIDSITNPVEDAYVKALKYDLDTNTYILQEIGVTDFLGKTIMHLTKYDEYYKFMVEYQGDLKKTTDPAYITADSLTIQISTEETELGQEYFDYESIDGTLSFNNVTNNFRLDFSDSSGITEQVCLETYLVSNFSITSIESSCTSSASGTILLEVDAVNGTNYLAKAIYYDGGVRYLLDSLYYHFPSSDDTIFGAFGLFVQILVTISCAFIAMASITVALILTPLSLILGNLIGLNHFTMAGLIPLQVAGIIIAFVVMKKS